MRTRLRRTRHGRLRAAGLRGLPPVAPDPAFRAALRERLVAEAAGRDTPGRRSPAGPPGHGADGPLSGPNVREADQR